MKEIKTEKLSLFVDGELEAQEADALLSSMCGEGDLKSCWHRYHLIGDALRNNLPVDTKHNLAERVSLALKDEPTLFCPISAKPASPSTLAVSKPRQSFTGFAIAASVAVVGFVAVSLLGWNIIQENQQLIAQQNERKNSAPVIHAVSTEGRFSASQVDPKLRSYMIDHANFTSLYSRPGLPPNVRVVTFSAER